MTHNFLGAKHVFYTKLYDIEEVQITMKIIASTIGFLWQGKTWTLKVVAVVFRAIEYRFFFFLEKQTRKCQQL